MDMICPSCESGKLLDFTKGDFLCDTCGESFTLQELEKLIKWDNGAFC